MFDTLKKITSDKNDNPEIVRILSVIGALACLGVFVWSNIQYAILTQNYNLKEVGEMMRDFAESFAFLIGSMAGGITAKTWIENRHGPHSNHRETDSKPPMQGGNFSDP